MTAVLTAIFPDARLRPNPVLFADTVPVPVGPKEAPLPTSIAAEVFVAPVIALKAGELPLPQADPDDKQIDPVPDTAAASAVATPVPKPVMPEIGRTVPWVRLMALGVPRFGVVIAQFVVRQNPPVPDTAAASAVATPVPSPVTPPTGTLVALIVPEPETPNVAPDPITMAAEVLVPPVKAENADDPLALLTVIQFVPLERHDTTVVPALLATYAVEPG